jgi:2-methylcitrate dehydratase PrpD
MSAVTRTLAAFAAASRFEAVPEPVRCEGVRAFVNWIGCAAGGAREACMDRAAAVLGDFTGAGDAIVIGRPERVNLLEAAFLNAMGSAALSFNDTHYATVAHPSSPVGAAAWSIAQHRPVTGAEFIHAIILGIEVQCRVGNVLSVPPAACGVGLSMQGLVGVIGAAVTAGRLLGLDAATLAVAMGLAANQSAGLREAHATMGSPFTPGHAARGGLLAALLAARGFTCSDSMIEGAKGFGVSFGTQPNFSAALAGLGETWETAALAYKPYPCGFVIHPVIDACLDIATRPGFDATRIARVELDVDPLCVKLTSRPTPANRNHATVSFQHWTAASLLAGEAGIAQLAESVVHDPRVAALRARVSATTVDGLGREAARACVTLEDGRTFRADVKHARGSAGRPMGDADIATKTRGQLRLVFDAGTAQTILARSQGVAALPRVDALCRVVGQAALLA